MSARLRILHVESDPDDAELVAEHLRRVGAADQLDVVRDRAGLEAALTEAAYDLVLASERPPGCEGLEVLALARRCDPEVPVIVISAAPSEERAAEVILGGATDCVLRHRLEGLGPAVTRAIAGSGERRRDEAEPPLVGDGELFRAVFENSPQALAVIDDQRRLVHVNAAAVALLGSDAAELTGCTVDSQGASPAPASREPGDEGAPTIGEEPEEWIGRAKDGSRRRVAFRRVAGVVPGMHLLVLSTPEGGRRPGEGRKNLAPQRTEMLGRLAGGVAQELDRLLEAMLDQTRLLIAGAGTRRRVRATGEELERYLRRSGWLTRRLLCLARRDTSYPEQLDLGRVVGEQLELLWHLVPEQVELSFEPPAVPLTVVADRCRLEEVAVGLVLSAAEALEHGGRLDVRCGCAGAHHAWLTVEVERSPERRPGGGSGVGSGIAETVVEGEPLGLALVRELVAEQGGSVEATVRSDGGHSVRVLLPLAGAGA